MRAIGELHRVTIAHASSRADVSRQLADLGRRLVELAANRCQQNAERLRQSQTRIDRFPSWRTSSGGCAHPGLKQS